MNDESFISIQNLSKRFGPVKAVDDVSINIRRGEFFSLLGPSGCGKTTLMRIIAGFEEASSGDVFIDGQPMGYTPPHKRPVNMVFQNYAIFPHLTVQQNIAYGLRKDKLPKDQMTRMVEEALEMIKLPGYGSRGAHQLSGGQRQRIALARALIKKPKVLLLDEPLGALDKKLREQMQLELRELQKSVGITFIFVTHDQEEAMTMSDRIAVMSEGQVLEVGAPPQLYHHPRTHFVADFLGSMNFFDGKIRDISNDMAHVDTEHLGMILVKKGDLPVSQGDKVVVALRPEHISVSNQKAEGETNTVGGQIANAAFLGDRSHIYVSVNGGSNTVMALMQNVEGTVSEFGGQKSDVWLNWSYEAGILLPMVEQ
ncbi:MAG: ABC transporter ATP-binding protein [Thalassospira sp.]|uniref:ABC transporter ATP-binding protein n=1 Tax=Thalassospira sp. TaxID=1912094 RepID=UPI003A837126